ncbi:MAG: hypothetical protein K8T89_27015 [Planctomycetes bacterium]|nr:hypothetical protein [Planctomycetota bacterium]
MFRSIIFSTAVLAFGLLGGSRASAAHPQLHEAIHDLRLAHGELKKADNNYGGHKEKAMHAIEAAYRQTEKCLEAAGDKYNPSFVPPGGLKKNHKNQHNLRHALVKLREANKDLKDASGNFGGHKKKALEDIDVAINQVEKCIEHIK